MIFLSHKKNKGEKTRQNRVGCNKDSAEYGGACGGYKVTAALGPGVHSWAPITRRGLTRRAGTMTSQDRQGPWQPGREWVCGTHAACNPTCRVCVQTGFFCFGASWLFPDRMPSLLFRPRQPWVQKAIFQLQSGASTFPPGRRGSQARPPARPGAHGGYTTGNAARIKAKLVYWPRSRREPAPAAHSRPSRRPGRRCHPRGPRKGALRRGLRGRRGRCRLGLEARNPGFPTAPPAPRPRDPVPPHEPRGPQRHPARPSHSPPALG